MPYKNRQKLIGADMYYHVYARGMNKMKIYRDEYDYTYFLYLFKKYLTKDFKEHKTLYGQQVEVYVDSVYGEVELSLYTLMPNHFHLLLFNLTRDGMEKLMRRVMSSYVKYFNKKYNREGSLIQGNYRAIPILNKRQLTTTGIYIHVNPLQAGLVSKVKNYPYSSYKYYWGGKKCRWLVPNKEIKESTDYKNFSTYLKDKNITDYESSIF